MASANADTRGPDVAPFADAGVPNGAALDSILPFPVALDLDKLVDAFPPFDPNDAAPGHDADLTLVSVAPDRVHSRRRSAAARAIGLADKPEGAKPTGAMYLTASRT